MKNLKSDKKLEKLSVGYLRKDSDFTTIYVGNLSYHKTEQQILEIFRKFGYVTFIRITRDKRTHKSKGIAFVQMQSKKSAKEAIHALDGTQLDGRTLKVSIALENQKSKNRPKIYKRKIKKTIEKARHK